jgi:hypothetical protein
MDRGYLDSLLLQLGNDRRDFILSQDEVTMTMALSPLELNAAHEPRAKPGLIGTVPAVTFKSVRGIPNLNAPSG